MLLHYFGSRYQSLCSMKSLILIYIACICRQFIESFELSYAILVYKIVRKTCLVYWQVTSTFFYHANIFIWMVSNQILRNGKMNFFFIHINFFKIVGRGVKVVPMLGGGVSSETFRTTQIRRPRPTGVGVEVHEQRSPSRHWKRATVCGSLRRLCIDKNVM